MANTQLQDSWRLQAQCFMETAYLNTEEIYHHALSSVIWVRIMEFTLKDTNVLSLSQKQRASCAQNNLLEAIKRYDKDPRPCCKDYQLKVLHWHSSCWYGWSWTLEVHEKEGAVENVLKTVPKFRQVHLILNSICNKATVSRINIKVSITRLILLLQVPFTAGPVILWFKQLN